MEITLRRRAPEIVQLLAAGNANASEDIWRAADSWLSKQGEYPLAAGDALLQAPVNPSRREAISRPIFEARPCFKACLANPAMRTLTSLRQDMAALARLAKEQ